MTKWKDRYRSAQAASEHRLSEQRFDKTPVAKRMHREAWKACPLEIQQEIDAALQTYYDAVERKFTDKFSQRWGHVCAYLDGELEAYREGIDHLMNMPAFVAKAQAEQAERDAERQAERERRAAEWNTPEAVAERERKREERKTRRLAKAAREAIAAAAAERAIAPRGSCLMCGRPLTDPVSQQRGFGTECWPAVLPFIKAAEDGRMDKSCFPAWFVTAVWDSEPAMSQD